MKKLIIPLVLAAAAAGCGNVCDRADAAANSVRQKAAACKVTLTFTSRATCDRGIDSCSDADVQTLNSIYDCQERLPTCVVGQEQAWVTQLNACAAAATSLSTACANAFR